MQFTTFTTTFVVRQRRRCKLVISLFYSFTNDILPSVHKMVFMKDPLLRKLAMRRRRGRFAPIRIFHNLHNLLYNLHDSLYNFSPPIIRYHKVPSYNLYSLHIINCEIVIFGLFLSCIKRGAHHKSGPKGVNLHQNPSFTIFLPYPIS